MQYLSVDNLPALAIFHSLDNLHDTAFRLAFWLPQVRQYLPFVVGLVLLWELLFPLAIFWRRLRWWILGTGVVFHLSTLYFMNIFFPICSPCIWSSLIGMQPIDYWADNSRNFDFRNFVDCLM